MTAKGYVNAVGRKIKCGNTKKREIRQKLYTEICHRMNKGESLNEIIAQKGSVKDVADAINASFDEKEVKRYQRSRILFVILPTIVMIGALIYYSFFQVANSVDLAESEYFEKAQVESLIQDTVGLLDQGDYEALKEASVEEMHSILNDETIGDAKKKICEDWGARTQFGNIRTIDVEKNKLHYAVGEVVATYENISVTYRMTYTQDLKLASLYMK